MGSSKRVEKIYFEIQESWLEQWSKQQIRDSKNAFLFNVLQDEGGDKGKLEAFINFCEDTIFEMQHAAEISSGDSSDSKIERAMRQRDYFLQQTTAGEQISKTLRVGYQCGLSAAQALRPENVSKSVKSAIQTFKSRSWGQLFVEILKLLFMLSKGIASIVLLILLTFCRFVFNLMTPEEEIIDDHLAQQDSTAATRARFEQPTFRSYTRRHDVDAFGIHIFTDESQSPPVIEEPQRGEQPVPTPQPNEARTPNGTGSAPLFEEAGDGADGYDYLRPTGLPSSPVYETQYSQGYKQQQGFASGDAVESGENYEPKIAEQLHLHSRGSIMVSTF